MSKHNTNKREPIQLLLICFVTIISLLVVFRLIQLEQQTKPTQYDEYIGDNLRTYYDTLEFDDYRLRFDISGHDYIHKDYYIDYIKDNEIYSIEIAELDINYNSDKNSLKVYSSDKEPSQLLDTDERCVILNTMKDKDLFEIKSVEDILIDLE